MTEHGSQSPIFEDENNRSLTIQCGVCNENVDMSNLKASEKHLSWCKTMCPFMTVENQTYHCIECKKKYTRRSDFSAHVKRHHWKIGGPLKVKINRKNRNKVSKDSKAC